jgi:hypothetical protein
MKRWLRMCLETQVSLPLFTIVLLAVVWGTTLHFIDSEEAASRELAAESAGELIATYEAQVARSITGIEQTLKVLQYSAERQGARGALPELQAHGLLPSGLVFIVSIVDARGEIVASNPAAASINVAQQEYFRIHQRQRSSYTYISHAMRDAANEDWHLHFTRRLEDARGEFAGVAIVEVDPAYFTSGYERWAWWATTVWCAPCASATGSRSASGWTWRPCRRLPPGRQPAAGMASSATPPCGSWPACT